MGDIFPSRYSDFLQTGKETAMYIWVSILWSPFTWDLQPRRCVWDNTMGGTRNVVNIRVYTVCIRKFCFKVSISITTWSGLNTSEGLRLATALPLFQSSTSTTTMTTVTVSSTSTLLAGSGLASTGWGQVRVE